MAATANGEGRTSYAVCLVAILLISALSGCLTRDDGVTPSNRPPVSPALLGAASVSPPATDQLVTLTFTSGYANGEVVWQVREPSNDLETNPALTLTTGQTLRATVVHGDDPQDTAPHNLQIRQDGAIVFASDDVINAGDTTSFDWSPAGAGTYVYECRFHPSTQRGTITVIQSDQGLAAPGPGVSEPQPVPDDDTANDDTTVPPVEPAPPAPIRYNLSSYYNVAEQQTSDLPSRTLKWIGTAAPIEGNTNPELTASVGVPLLLSIQHGNDLGDIGAPGLPAGLGGHQLRIVMANGDQVAQSDEVVSPGDNASLEWTPTLSGTYFYLCPAHRTMNGTIAIGSAAYTFESAYDVVNNFRWRGVGGTIEGIYNPTIEISVGTSLRISVRHGNDINDNAPHNFYIQDASQATLATTPDLNVPGDTGVIEWTPSLRGTYTYLCAYHAGTQRGTIEVT